ELAQFLGRQGARVTKAMPELDFDRYLRDYLCLLMVQMSVARSREQREARAKTLAVSQNFMFVALAPGLTPDAAGLIVLLKRREEARAAWRRFFQDFDVLVGPTTLDVAFPHIYPMWAIFAGQPATAFPAGLSRQGLPLGLQAIGPYLEDRT